MIKISRRAFLLAAGASGAAFFCEAALVEPEWLEIGRHEIKTPSPSGPPIKLLHLADLHASWCVHLPYIERSIETGLQFQPDLICVTGDFITSKFADMDSYARILSRLSGAAPVYATLGNHDGGHWAGHHHGYGDSHWVRQLLAKSGIPLLHNRSTHLQIHGRTVRLVGLGDVYSGECWPEPAFSVPSPDAQFTIALSHNPDTKLMLKPYPWDLMLCGHTHGGQFYLPIIGAPFAPVRDKRFIAGLYPWKNRWIHITKGVGNVAGLRFNCRPEVSFLTII